MKAFEMRCYQRLLNIQYTHHVTNDHEKVCSKIQAAIGEYDYADPGQEIERF